MIELLSRVAAQTGWLIKSWTISEGGPLYKGKQKPHYGMFLQEGASQVCGGVLACHLIEIMGASAKSALMGSPVVIGRTTAAHIANNFCADNSGVG